MIVERSTSERLRGFAADACVVGSGPVGICTALELAEKGLRVLLLESGGRRTAEATRALSRAEIVSTDTHVPPELAATRRLGGTASLWGGRCVPLDPIDFRPRPWLDLPPWPIAGADLAPYLARACTLMAAGDPVYSDPPVGVSADPSFQVDALERWSRMPRLQRLHWRVLYSYCVIN